MSRRILYSVAILLWTWSLAFSAKEEPVLSWCQHDDPAYVEIERRKQGISNREAGKVACPEGTDAQQRPEQLILPMPCGRRMVLRRVEFHLEHVLDHVQASLGSVPEASNGNRDAAWWASINGPWDDAVSGGFAKSRNDHLTRYYYIGKYEVTEPQFSLMRKDLFRKGAPHERTAPACAKYVEQVKEFRGTRVLPAVEVSWLDAVNFAHQYSEWLLKVDRERISSREVPYLPWEESAPGYFRLPTEAEWEFAARAGVVDRTSRSKRFYAVLDDSALREASLEEIAYLNTPQNPAPEGSTVSYIGRHLPNNLSLYDMIGNADEIVLGLFQPLRPDGLAGLRGGFVVRGGHALEIGAPIGLGYRREVAFFNMDGAVRTAFTGFRLLLSAPVFNYRRDDNWIPLPGKPSLAEDLNEARKKLLTEGPPEHDKQVKVIADLKNVVKDQKAEMNRLEELREADQKRIDELKEQFEQAKREHGATEELRTLWAATEQELQQLRSERERWNSRSAEFTASLAALQADLEKSTTELNEREKRIRRGQFQSAVLMYGSINNLYRRILVAENTVKNLKADLRGVSKRQQRKIQELLNRASARIPELRRINKANFKHYVETIYALADAGRDAVSAAHRAVAHQFEIEGLTLFDDIQSAVAKHTTEAMKAGGALPRRRLDAWFEEIEEMRGN